MCEPTDSEKTAIVQGEIHLSNDDVNALLERNLEDWDTLLVEGRVPVYNLQNSKFGFGYYAIGAIFLTTASVFLHKVFDGLKIAQQDPVDEVEIDSNKRIDAKHREIWGFTSDWLRWTLLLFAAFGSIAILTQPEVVGNLFYKCFSWFPYREWHLYLLFFPTLPGLVHIFSIVNPTNSSERNQAMVENIVEYTTENNYDKALILVGEMHREGIVERLEDRGWDVESNQTHSKLGNGISRAYNLFGDWR
ncbi:putative membrane protein [Halorhabdus sp. SVX81]|uniref:hypothetical protein n=1 Tax=Halorhabdus sp. SVX81 TaxID=2978283 RepID=UPI0023DBE3BE|nr:hypothetical protein [Halorhabdus sp. SVX81]WEL18672.1 putative membrane protein [Halorhabdus sp. SVX81]